MRFKFINCCNEWSLLYYPKQAITCPYTGDNLPLWIAGIWKPSEWKELRFFSFQHWHIARQLMNFKWCEY